jgi:hypothetical protein
MPEGIAKSELTARLAELQAGQRDLQF